MMSIMSGLLLHQAFGANKFFVFTINLLVRLLSPHEITDDMGSVLNPELLTGVCNPTKPSRRPDGGFEV